MRSLNYVLSNRQSLRKVSFLQESIEKNEFIGQTYDYLLHLRREITQACQALKDIGVELVFVKSYSDLPLDSDNFDVLLKQDDLNTAKTLLEKNGFKELERVREPFKWLYRKVSGNYPVSIHLHTKLGWEGVEFVNKDEVLGRCREVMINGMKLRFPSAEQHLLMTAAHAYFENRSLRLSDLMYAVDAIRGGPMDWTQLLDWCSADHWYEAFNVFLCLAKDIYQESYGERLINSNDQLTEMLKGPRKTLVTNLFGKFKQTKDLPLKIPNRSVGLSFVRKVLENNDETWKGKIETITSAGWSYAKRRMPLAREIPANLICFSGHDGTGKTSHALQLRIELVKRIHVMNDPLVEGPFKINYIWSRGIGVNFGPILGPIRLILLGSTDTTQTEYRSRSNEFTKREPIRTLWAYTKIIDELLVLLKVRGYLLRRQMVICDRYMYDVLVDVECGLKKKLPRVTKQVVKHLSPEPSITFLMDLEPTETAKRREEADQELIQCSRQNYREHCQESKRCVLVDAGAEFDMNQKEIERLVLKAIFIPS